MSKIASQEPRDAAHPATLVEQALRDHSQILALLDAEHPLHATAWEQLRAMVARVVYTLGGPQLCDQSDEIDDLIQEIVKQIWRGLGSFRHQSSLRTWQYRVIARCLHQRQRTLHAQKRWPRAALRSLDELAEQAGLADEPRTSAPDRAAFDHALGALVRSVLGQQADQRLGWVFEQAVYQQQPLRTIAAQLAISQARAHGLLQQARQVLSASPAIREWFEFDLRQQPQA